MTTSSATAQRPGPLPRTGPARVAVMPAFNEAATIEAVLDDLYPRIDRLVIVNDGSADDTGAIADRWSAGHDRVTVVHFPENRGLSAALRAGWDEVRAMLDRGEVRPGDVAFSIDADGQHEPAAIEGMIDHLVAGNYDCVIGFRDLSYHTPYKVLGNAAMTLIGCVSGWMRFHDIESGYRVFRIAPLLEAQQYYDGYRYSETVEVAVILARLGYRVDNTYRVSIPVARTRTRLSDAAVDAVCMPLSWYRLACWRALPAAQRTQAALALPALLTLMAVAALAVMLTHATFLGNDSAHSYAHVWYLSHAIYDHGELPLHVSQLDAGDALMFPYAFVPWLPAALIYPAFGDWTVTLAMVAGVVLMVAGMWRFRPAMRDPHLFAIFLVNPLLWDGIFNFQLATTWSFAFFFFAAAAADRRRYPVAALLFALSFAAHPMMGSAAAILYLAWESVRRRRLPLRMAAAMLAGAAAASPIFAFMALTPTVQETSAGRILLSVTTNMGRLSVVALPLLLPALAPAVVRWRLPLAAAGAAVTVAALAIWQPVGLWRSSEPRFAAYLAAPIDATGTYRVVTGDPDEDGMTQVMRAGAILSSDFFSESEHRQVFSSLEGYRCLLATKHTSHVLIHFSAPAADRRSEFAMLDALAARGEASLEFQGPDGTRAYHVSVPPSAARGSLRDCGV